VAEAYLEDFERFRYAAGAGAQGFGRHRKVVHFIRHAGSVCEAACQAFPEGDARRGDVLADGAYFDAPLSSRGLSRCERLREERLLREGGVPPDVGLVVVSPLTRALQTATSIFGSGEAAPAVVVLEALREFNSSSPHPCDWRRSKEELEKSFPHADFSHLAPGGDMVLGPGILEVEESCDGRLMWFLAWLRRQPQTSVACISHDAVLTRLLREHLGPAGFQPSTGGSAPGHFEHLEVRSIPIAFE